MLVGVLKGALLFLADLARAIPDIDVTIDFISISRFAPDSGRVKILHDLDTDIGGRDVVLVEDIVDTGLTLAYLVGQLTARGPRRLSTCAIPRSAAPADRAPRRRLPWGSSSEWSTSSVTDCTSTTSIATCRTSLSADRDTLVARPDAYVDELYRRSDSAEYPGGRVTFVPTEEP